VVEGTYQVGSTLPVTVPAGTASLTIISQLTQAPGPQVEFLLSGVDILVPNAIIPSPIQGPMGIYFNDLDAGPTPPIPELSDVYYFPTGSAVGAITLPNTSAMLSTVAQSNGIPPGTWNIGVNDYAYECSQYGAACIDGGSTSSIYDVKVLLKPGPLQTTGTLDLAIYLISASLPTSSQAATDPNMLRMVQGIQRMYGAAGVCVGTVTFYDVPSWAQSRYSTLNSDLAQDPCSDLHQMFTLSLPTNTLNLFFVDAITSTGDPTGTSTVGMDGTIPGPATVGGSIQSGAAVNGSFVADNAGCTSSFQPTACGPDVVAYISAHEGGHFLGLYHVSEATGDLFDPLLDSPICNCATCARPGAQASCESNGTGAGAPYTMQGSDCTKGISYCGGGTDLMFWLLNEASTGTLTPEQGRVMLGSPAVH
jgi:hypothetical protein